MVFKISEDKKFLILKDASEIEIEQLKLSLTKRIKNYFFNPLVKKKLWDGYISYFYNNMHIPIGLWGEIIDICKKYNYEVNILDLESLFDNNIKYEKIKQWIEEFFKDFELDGFNGVRDYQIDTVYKILKYKKCCAELATSAGKTLIIFLVIAYLLKNNLIKNILIIVPNISLVTQIIENFYLFNNKNQLDLKIGGVYSGSIENKNSNIIVGTYQSLSKRSLEYFKKFDVVVIDEMHKIKAASIKNILEKCKNTNYQFGLTGTFPKEELDRLTLMAYTGPLINKIDAFFLQKEGYIAKCEIKILELNYASLKIRESLYNLAKHINLDERKKLYDVEKDFVINNKDRLNIITNIISKVTKNSLVLFYHIEYGKMLYNKLKEICKDKLVYYIDGSIDDGMREFYKKKMEQNDNIILIASFGTFSTGINIKNIHNIFLTESFKSEIIIRQSIGRGLRLHDKKDKLIIIDFVDNLCYKKWKNILYKHGLERQKIYEEQQFPYIIKELNFIKNLIKEEEK